MLGVCYRYNLSQHNKQQTTPNKSSFWDPKQLDFGIAVFGTQNNSTLESLSLGPKTSTWESSFLGPKTIDFGIVVYGTQNNPTVAEQKRYTGISGSTMLSKVQPAPQAKAYLVMIMKARRMKS